MQTSESKVTKATLGPNADRLFASWPKLLIGWILRQEDLNSRRWWEAGLPSDNAHQLRYRTVGHMGVQRRRAPMAQKPATVVLRNSARKVKKKRVPELSPRSGPVAPALRAETDSFFTRLTGTDGKRLGRFFGAGQAVYGGIGRQVRTRGAPTGKTENPGKHAVSQGLQSPDDDSSKLEAPGIEPGSRGPSAAASTCVAC